MIKVIKSSHLTSLHDRKTLIYLVLVLGFALLIHLFCMHTTSLLVEEAYYWNYAQHLDFSYLDHPPMVAVLIKFFTMIFGINEFSVRSASLFCWLITGFFSYKLSELMNRGSGPYALILLAIWPFFFFQLIIITPDVPLLACWSASLYYLYRSLTLNESHYWYATGMWLGFGMLSKYTICLLGLATLFYMIAVPNARRWFTQKEPYLCVLITFLIFTPVIYWNATHDWVSFIFQGNRRIAATTTSDFHYVIGLIILFITPLGTLGFLELLRKDTGKITYENTNTKKFIKIFILVPLGFFLLFSVNHKINFNWIGPLFLALIPWVAALSVNIPSRRIAWIASAFFMLSLYSVIILVAAFNKSEAIQLQVFKKLVAWEPLIKQFHEVAEQVEAQTQGSPAFVPLDSYPLASELAFYQAKFKAQNGITKTYPIIGRHIFGWDSLMYRYWSKNENLSGKTLIIISKDLHFFDDPGLIIKTKEIIPLAKIMSQGEGQGVRNIPYYYKVVQMKS